MTDANLMDANCVHGVAWYDCKECPQGPQEQDNKPWEADDWKERPVADRLQVVHDMLDDPGVCAYFRRGEPGQDPDGICSFGCYDEPNCMAGACGPWPSELLREVIADLSEVKP